MTGWLTKFRKKRRKKLLSVACWVELKSGYADNQRGMLEGRLVAIDDREFSVRLRRIYFSGLYLFDPENSVRLLFRSAPETISLAVRTVSYKTNSDGYLTILRWEPKDGTGSSDPQALLARLQTGAA